MPADSDRRRRSIAASSSPSRRDLLLASAPAAASLLLPARPARADDLFCGYYAENQSVTPQWAFKTPWSEGFVDVSNATKIPDAKTFLRVLGSQAVASEANHLPVLCLHGGPGLGFKYMEACEVLASERREVASYDQIGCARSALKPRLSDGAVRAPPPPGTFTPELFDAELTAIREAAGLDRVHIVAHGWGAMLALDHALGPGGGGKGVASVTLISAPPSYKRLIEDRVASLSAPGFRQDYAEVLMEGDAGAGGGSALSDAGRALYDKAMAAWIDARVSARAAGACYEGLRVGGAGEGFGALRNTPASDVGVRSSSAVWKDMAGGKMFAVDGALSDWDADANGRLASAAESGVRAVKVYRGENDALSRDAAMEVVDGLARGVMDKSGVAFEEVEGAGSCVHLDRSAFFLDGVNAFISAHDA
jgi:pimeloyl-ACP methyl ester carboxylesterase